MKVSDYIVEFLIEKGITDVFGYPGGSVANLMDSFYKKRSKISAHVMYHEQAAGFAACAYSAVNGIPGVVYATGGPGATNLVTAIGNAYYDSIPVIFLTGNVNTYETKGKMKVRQCSFQESDIIPVVESLTKYSVYVNKCEEIGYYLEKAYSIAMQGRRGPVLLDLPMDVQRGNVDLKTMRKYTHADIREGLDCKEKFREKLTELLKKSKRPCFLFGNAIKLFNINEIAKNVVEKFKIPYVTSMIAFDVLEHNPYYYGFIGAYGMRQANFIVAKSDLVISIGSRMDIRQVGAKRENFAREACIMRIDIDDEELKYQVHKNEYSFNLSVEDAFDILMNIQKDYNYEEWLSICNNINDKLKGYDDRMPNEYMEKVSELIEENTIVTTDVGQNQVWVAQSFAIKNGQKVLFSGGMGAMGYALPAAIGAYYANPYKKVVCICGDGGLQMNIQELQYIVRENIPIKIVVLNNNALGMIRHFQEMYFDGCYFQTTNRGGYTSPNFDKVAEAYGLYHKVANKLEDIEKCKELLTNDFPALLEIRIYENTYVLPKLEYGKPNQDQWPSLERKLYKELEEL